MCGALFAQHLSIALRHHSADRRLAQPRIRLAAILLQQGDRERARALVEEAARLEIDPDDAQAIQSLRERLR